MHLLPSFGESINEIKSDGFKVHYKINMSIDGYNHFSHLKSLGIFLSSFSDVIYSEKPDWIILAGDRGEQLMAAIAGAYTYIPVLHIQAGERSGNIDGMSRHAIGKFSHIHIASNADAERRLERLGEEKFRIHNLGAPQLDELVSGFYLSKPEIQQNLNLDLDKKYLLVVQHPVTEEFDQAEFQIAETMIALNKVNLTKLVILPNNDAGSIKIREGIEKHLSGEYVMFSNIKREEYLTLLKHAEAIVGNSSSGLLEAPTFCTPAVNIGRRQLGREQGINVINTEYESVKILKAINKAISPEFKKSLKNRCVNPYGDGKSSEKILHLLLETEINNKLIVKDLTY